MCFHIFVLLYIVETIKTYWISSFLWLVAFVIATILFQICHNKKCYLINGFFFCYLKNLIVNFTCIQFSSLLQAWYWMLILVSGGRNNKPSIIEKSRMKHDPSINPHLYVRSIRNVWNIGFRFKFFIKRLRLITYKGYIKFNLKLPETY